MWPSSPHRRGPHRRHTVWVTLASALGRRHDPGRAALARAVEALGLAAKLDDVGRTHLLHVTQSGLAVARAGDEALAWATALRALLPGQEEERVATIVGALKYPTAALRP